MVKKKHFFFPLDSIRFKCAPTY
uniref:Uncharacterized protein n=1 Tax=Rhizophora mucronata TaxID=61149 RepID=A0A2P2J1T1_RHIMU